MSSYVGIIHKLQRALNANDAVVFVSQDQFYSETQKRIITMYVIYESEINKNGGRRIKTEVLRTPSQVDVISYLGSRYKAIKDGKPKTVEELLQDVQARREKYETPDRAGGMRQKVSSAMYQKEQDIIKHSGDISIRMNDV